MAALSMAMRAYASRCFDERQRGFVSGRAPTGNIVVLGKRLGIWARRHDTDIGIMLFDIEADFQSAAHGWVKAFFTETGKFRLGFSSRMRSFRLPSRVVRPAQSG